MIHPSPSVPVPQWRNERATIIVTNRAVCLRAIEQTETPHNEYQSISLLFFVYLIVSRLIPPRENHEAHRARNSSARCAHQFSSMCASRCCKLLLFSIETGNTSANSIFVVVVIMRSFAPRCSRESKAVTVAKGQSRAPALVRADSVAAGHTKVMEVTFD